MKRTVRFSQATYFLALLLAFAPSLMLAQAWNPGTASPATNIDRTGNVTIGDPAAALGASNTRLTVNAGDYDYQVGTAVFATASTNDKSAIGSVSSRLARAETYFAAGSLRGVQGTSTPITLDNSVATKVGSAEGGLFTVTLDNPIADPGTGS